MTSAGEMHRLGQGVSENLAEAVSYYEKGAQLGGCLCDSFLWCHVICSWLVFLGILVIGTFLCHRHSFSR